jgi:hypothetical protein
VCGFTAGWHETGDVLLKLQICYAYNGSIKAGDV